MEHKFVIEIIFREEKIQPKENPSIPFPQNNVQALQIDPVLLQKIFGQLIQALNNVQLNKNKQKEDGKEKR